MKRIICLMLSIVIVLSAVPAMAADNTVKLTGEGIFIDNDTESTVWADQKGGAVISDITSDVKISGSDAAKHIVGMVGSSEGNWKGSLTVERCIFSGTINLPNVSDCVGGVMGYANDFVSILYCGFNGSVAGKKDGYIGGVLGYINNENFRGLKNSFAAGKTNGAALIGTVRNCSNSIENCIYGKVLGHICY